MKVLYVLDQSLATIEPFIAREIVEVIRQGDEIVAAFRDGDGYRFQKAGPRERSAESPPPAPAAGAGGPIAVAALTAPGGFLHAVTHVRRAGKRLGSGLRQAAALAREARRQRVGVLHAHFAGRACEDAMLASWFSGIPFTFTAHGYDVHLEPPDDMGARARSAASVITVSRANAGVLADRLGVPLEKIQVIACGVDTRRFSPAAGRGAAVPGLVLSVARLHRDKGPDILLDAVARLAAGGVDFRLELVGEGDERGALEGRLAQDATLARHVALSGAADETGVIDALHRATLFVLASRSEGMPVALLEAMACGLPCVATSVGGVPELLEEGRCGVLVPPEDSAGLSLAIAGLLRDPQRRAALGQAARARVEAEFRLEPLVRRLRSVWHAAASPRGAGATA